MKIVTKFPSDFILHDIIIEDTKTKKLYTFNASDTTRTIIDSELTVLTYDEVDDIKNVNELTTSYIWGDKYNAKA